MIKEILLFPNNTVLAERLPCHLPIGFADPGSDPVTALLLFLLLAHALLEFGSLAWSDISLAVASRLILLVLLEGFKPLVRRLTPLIARVAISRSAAAIL